MNLPALIHSFFHQILCVEMLGMVVHTCNSSTIKAEAGALQVQGQPGLHSETLSQKICMCIDRYLYIYVESDVSRTECIASVPGMSWAMGS
jgi:hypothetical protein